MKAYWITPGPGGTKVELREAATPEPRLGEILVRVRAAALNRGLPYFESGRLRPLIDKVFGFEALPAALAFMEADAQVGKIVVRVRD